MANEAERIVDTLESRLAFREILELGQDINIANAFGCDGTTHILTAADIPKMEHQIKTLTQTHDRETAKGNFYKYAYEGNIPKMEQYNTELNSLWDTEMEEQREAVENAEPGEKHVVYVSEVINSKADKKTEGEDGYLLMCNEAKKCFQSREKILAHTKLWAGRVVPPGTGLSSFSVE